jgi:hypothetical protein
MTHQAVSVPEQVLFLTPVRAAINVPAWFDACQAVRAPETDAVSSLVMVIVLSVLLWVDNIGLMSLATD